MATSQYLPETVIRTAGPPIHNLKPRLATISDVPALVPLINEAYKDARWFKNPAYHNRIDNNDVLVEYMTQHPEDKYIILEDAGTGDVCATVKLVAPDNSSNEETCGMSLLAIAPEHQGKGIAKYLFKLLCALALYMDEQEKGKGWSDLQVEVMGVQPHLISIYSSWGFSLVEGWDDSVVPLPSDFWNVEPHQQFMVAMRKKLGN
ncbi:hypothetical protein BDR26DRAFT_869853 [Obelidium mucronatum]|nr:hypothetical protein BDR26DRAFT_869853 [Obelidium mucronatum]